MKRFFLLVIVLGAFLTGCIQQPFEAITAFQREKAEFENRSGSAVILIQNNSFNPPQLIVKTGAYVSWENLDNEEHFIVADDGSFKFRLIAQGKTGGSTGISKKFKTTGAFPYHCEIHPQMKGTLIVKEDVPEACGDNFCTILEFENNTCTIDCSRI